MTEVDVKKLLKFAGFKPCDCAQCSKGGTFYPSSFYIYPDDGVHQAPDFNDLNECFKWLEPPLYERFGIYHIGFARVKGVGYNCYMNRAAVEYPHREEGRSKELMTLGHGKTLGEAFCDATLKVINRYPELEKGIIEQLKGQSR